MHINESAREMNTEQRKIEAYVGALLCTLVLALLIVYFSYLCYLWCSKKFAAAKKEKEENPRVNQYHRFQKEDLYSLIDDPKQKIQASSV